MNYLEMINELLEPILMGEILEEDSVFSEFEVDSFDLLELILQIEDELEIAIEDKEISKIKTVNDLIRLIEAQE